MTVSRKKVPLLLTALTLWSGLAIFPRRAEAYSFGIRTYAFWAVGDYTIPPDYSPLVFGLEGLVNVGPYFALGLFMDLNPNPLNKTIISVYRLPNVGLLMGGVILRAGHKPYSHLYMDLEAGLTFPFPANAWEPYGIGVQLGYRFDLAGALVEISPHIGVKSYAAGGFVNALLGGGITFALGR
ncbi:MAG: hypothetical protein ACXWP5_03825 [Bdellovibrionota bacterium]